VFGRPYNLAWKKPLVTNNLNVSIACNAYTKIFLGNVFESYDDPGKSTIRNFRKLIFCLTTTKNEYDLSIFIWHGLYEDLRSQFHGAFDVVGERALTTTEQGYLGLASSGARDGDLVSVVLSCDAPVLSYRLMVDDEHGSAAPRWQTIRLCCVPG